MFFSCEPEFVLLDIFENNSENNWTYIVLQKKSTLLDFEVWRVIESWCLESFCWAMSSSNT